MKSRLKYFSKHLHNPQVFKSQGIGLIRWFSLPLICRIIDFGLIAGFERFVPNWIFLPASSDCSPLHLICCHHEEGKWSKAFRFCWLRGALLVGLVSGSEAVFLNNFCLKDHLNLWNNLWTILCSALVWQLGPTGGIIVQIRQFVFRWSHNNLFIES